MVPGWTVTVPPAPVTVQVAPGIAADSLTPVTGTWFGLVTLIRPVTRKPESSGADGVTSTSYSNVALCPSAMFRREESTLFSIVQS